MVDRQVLLHWLDQTLQVDKFKDYAPNGLQVQGRQSSIHKIATCVTASLACLQEAVRRGADTVLVHHGWFWKNEDPRVIGMKYARLAFAIEHGLNIIAYHLPLDAHTQYGNNAQLAQVLGIEVAVDELGNPKTLDDMGLVWTGQFQEGLSVSDFATLIADRLGRKPTVVGHRNMIKSLAWCTGGAQGYFDMVCQAGVDAYITGEASERNCHEALEQDTVFVSAGHHATERYGVQALGEAIVRAFGLEVSYIELDNPI